MSEVCQKVPTAFPWYQSEQSSQRIARSHLPFSKRESIISIGRGGAVAGGGGVANPLDDDGAEGPVAGAAGEGASAVGPVAKSVSA